MRFGRNKPGKVKTVWVTTQKEAREQKALGNKVYFRSTHTHNRLARRHRYDSYYRGDVGGRPPKGLSWYQYKRAVMLAAKREFPKGEGW